MTNDVLDEMPSTAQVNENYLRAFFDRQSDYYLLKYYEYHGGNKFTFNIGSFFCGIFWFLYRKLFLEFLLTIALLTAVSAIQFLIVQTFELDYGTSQMID